VARLEVLLGRNERVARPVNVSPRKQRVRIGVGRFAKASLFFTTARLEERR
jgi:hypothetical protein